MRVLYLTPYSPLSPHDHAANDIARPLVRSLSLRAELHVCSPSGFARVDPEAWPGITFHEVPNRRFRSIHRLTRFPAAYRKDWPLGSRRHIQDLVRAIQPDVVHAEYFQSIEALLGVGSRTARTMTMHDLPSRVAAQERLQSGVLSSGYHRMERRKIQHYERVAMRRLDGIITLSDRDARAAQQMGATADFAPIGVETTASYRGSGSNVVLFAGAMWRSANENAVTWLAREVMPRVWREFPDVRLRVVGARPTPDVIALAAEANVDVIGEVDDFDEEFARAAVVVAPSRVDAGVLLKALKAMRMGAPVVLNSASSEPIHGFVHGEHGFSFDSPDEYAWGVTELLRSRATAEMFGTASAALVRDNYNWNVAAERYVKVWQMAVRARGVAQSRAR